MRKPYKVTKHPQPTAFKRWAVVSTRDGCIVSEHKRRSNAQDVAALSNSVFNEYGSLYMPPKGA